MVRIGVIGAGAWGTALAMVAGRAGARPLLWAREPAVAAAINTRHENPRRLPGMRLEAAIRAESDLGAAVGGTDGVLLAVPAQAVRAVAGALAGVLAPGVPVVLCAKGIEIASGRPLSTVLAEVLPANPVAVLSGPSLAAEVARGLPAALTLAAPDEGLAASVAGWLAGPVLRLYTTTDVIGTELGGALKNVYAIACGIAVGHGLGENARAALLTRGFAEMVRFARALGARDETLGGLSGLGDLVLSATTPGSRNYAYGLIVGGVGRAEPPAALVEGIATAKALGVRRHRAAVEMPIAEAVDAIVNRGAAVAGEIERLLARPLRAEGP